MTTTADELREEVRRRYAESARAVTQGRDGCGCGNGEFCCRTGGRGEAKFGEALYDAEQRGELPDAAVLASLGCGNPIAVAELHEGETVLDLGSGGGIDVILSAKRVGPTGTAYGLDMTDEMLALAQQNAADAGVTNVHFLKGVIEEIPLPADTVDVVISNCVINLSVDKPAVLTEMARVLKPGGRIGISDIVAEDHLTPGERAERGSYVGCIAGALSKQRVRGGARRGRLRAELSRVHARGRRRNAQRDHQGGEDARARAQGLPVIQPAAKRGLLLVATSEQTVTISDLRPEHWSEVARIVRRSFTRRELKVPKTEASMRAVPLQARALDALDRVEDDTGSPLVFPGERGGYLDIHHFRPYQWRPAQKTVGITPLRRVDDLRHTMIDRHTATSLVTDASTRSSSSTRSTHLSSTRGRWWTLGGRRKSRPPSALKRKRCLSRKKAEAL